MSQLINGTDLDDALLDPLQPLFQDWLTYRGQDPYRAQAALARYEFVLSEFDVSRQRCRIIIDPIGVGRRTEIRRDIIALTRPRPAGTLKAHYLDAIATDDDLAYRGMSWEEWEAIQKTGYVQSHGGYNIGQENLTLWGETFSTAAYYANGFTPWAFKPSFSLPGVVIAIPREGTLSRFDRDDIPDGERGTLGKFDAEGIEAVWMLLASEVEGGYFSIDIARRGSTYYFDQGSSSGPSATVHVRAL